MMSEVPKKKIGLNWGFPWGAVAKTCLLVTGVLLSHLSFACHLQDNLQTLKNSPGLSNFWTTEATDGYNSPKWPELPQDVRF